MAKKSIKAVKTGFFSRGLSLAKLSVGASVQLASNAISNTIKGESKDALTQLLQGQAVRIAKELGELKGTVMKAGQLLSMYGERILPPEVNAILKTLQNDSPIVEWPAIEKVLKRQLGIEKLAELEIETEPLASASIGQVHRAKIISTGEWLAIKVQYPGVDAAIESDLRALKRILSLTQILPRGSQMDDVFQEIREMMRREVDYENEFREMGEYAELLKGDLRYFVPKTYSRYSTKRVIATELVSGAAVDSQEIANLSQDRRNRIGSLMLELYFREVFAWGRVQTDPHLGNYKINIDPEGQNDQLVLLDFGAVRHFPKKFLIPYTRMVRGAFLENYAELIGAGIQLDFLREDDSEEGLRVFYDLCVLIMEPFISQAERYDWVKGDLPERALLKAKEFAIKLKLRQPPREVVFLDRKMGGVYIFLSVLKADFAGRKFLETALAQTSF